MTTRVAAAAGAALLLGWPAAASAETTSAKLEARVKELEAALAGVKAELAARTDGSGPAIERIAPPAGPAAAGLPPERPRLTFGGYVKLDAAISNFQHADPAYGDLGRDFYLPGTIPIVGAGEGRKMDFNARQTRLWISGSLDLDGHKATARIEGDFQALPGNGDGRTTNPSDFALRRAYVTFDNWLFGQEWSNFQNVGALPETADYVGPTEGTVFSRQAQIRYTRGPFSLALENPETTVTPNGGGPRLMPDDSAVPDVTARFTLRRSFGELSVAGVGRRLSIRQGGLDSSTMGWGVSVSGRVAVGERDDVRFMLTGGDGIGRYVGLNFSNDAVVDAAGELEAIPLAAGFAAYRHVWRPGLRSSVIYSAQRVDNPRLMTGGAVNRSAQSVRTNLVWSPTRDLDLGAEYMIGERKLEGGSSGRLDRLQAFAKYAF
ncbi:MAG: porin [Phenylobacterium sp.]|nr:porin [Phenylobacterium sp.]